MLNVKEIEKFVDDGDNDPAHQALDDLLELGPSNTAALKLRARLFEYEGRFADEVRIWDQIASIDNEDTDAVEFLLKKQLEDREHFYFTDDLPGGGRRFLAYPRTLVNTSAMGLLGCLAFLMSVRFAETYPVLKEPNVMLAIFGLFVAFSIKVIVTFFKSLKSVSVNYKGIDITTRLNTVFLKWTEVERVCLARSEHKGYGILSLVLIPKDKQSAAYEINMNQGASSSFPREILGS